MTDDNSTDDELRDRLRDRLDLKSEAGDADGADSNSTDQKNTDAEDADGGADAGTDAKMDSLEEAVAAVAANTDGDVSEEDVMDMLEPIMGDTESQGDYGDMDDDEDEDVEQDADGELKAEDVKEIVGATLDAKLDEHGVVTEDDFETKLNAALEERIDSKLDETVTEDQLDTLVDNVSTEIENLGQKARTGSTPEPSNAGESALTADDLLSGGDD